MARLADESLVAKVRAQVGEALIEVGDRPVFILVRAMPSADYETIRFVELCRDVGAEPVIVSMLGDRFTSINLDKYRRARMTFHWPARTRGLRAGDMRDADGARMSALRTRRGSSLAEFHAELLRRAHPEVRVLERTDWLCPGGRSDYLRFFSLVIAGAVLVEVFDDDPGERAFFRERMLPQWWAARELFGVSPLVTCHFAANELTDAALWGYPGELYPTATAILGEQDPRGPRRRPSAQPRPNTAGHQRERS